LKNEVTNLASFLVTTDIWCPYGLPASRPRLLGQRCLQHRTLLLPNLALLAVLAAARRPAVPWDAVGPGESGDFIRQNMEKLGENARSMLI